MAEGFGDCRFETAAPEFVVVAESCTTVRSAPEWESRSRRSLSSAPKSIAGWAHAGKGLPAVRARLRRHLLRLTGKNRELRTLLRLRSEARDEPSSMVCDHLARTEGHSNFHERSAAITGERQKIGRPRIGTGLAAAQVWKAATCALALGARHTAWPAVRRKIVAKIQNDHESANNEHQPT